MRLPWTENTEVVVFRKEHSEETRAAFWQMIVRDSEDRSEQVKCALGSIVVARARPSRCKSVDPNRPLQGSFWSSAASQAEGLGVARECEHIVLSKYNAAQYEGNIIASPAFGDVYCKQRDSDEVQFVKRVLLTSPTTSEVMGPPPPAAEVKPRSLNESFGASADSLYQESVVVEASDASDGTGSRQVKRERDGANKASWPMTLAGWKRNRRTAPRPPRRWTKSCQERRKKMRKSRGLNEHEWGSGVTRQTRRGWR